MYKPLNEEVKLELSINTDSPNFDSVKAEIIAQEVDGDKEQPKKDNTLYFENKMVDRVFLQSSKSAGIPNRYAAAAYNGKEIHLTSLKGRYKITYMRN